MHSVFCWLITMVESFSSHFSSSFSSLPLPGSYPPCISSCTSVLFYLSYLIFVFPSEFPPQMVEDFFICFILPQLCFLKLFLYVFLTFLFVVFPSLTPHIFPFIFPFFRRINTSPLVTLFMFSFVSLLSSPSLFEVLLSCPPLLLYLFALIQIFLPSCLLPSSPSVFVLAVLAYSAGSTPAMPIILTVERRKRKKEGGLEEKEGGLEDLCTHKYLQSS